MNGSAAQISTTQSVDDKENIEELCYAALGKENVMCVKLGGNNGVKVRVHYLGYSNLNTKSKSGKKKAVREALQPCFPGVTITIVNAVDRVAEVQKHRSEEHTSELQ